MKNHSKQVFGFLFLMFCFLVQSCNLNQQATVSIEAALVFKSGDVKPVARTEFMLLDKNFETILQESDFTSELPEDLKGKISKISPLKAFALLANATEKAASYSVPTSTGKDEFRLALMKATAAVKPHTLYSTTTDFQGKAEFKEVKAGEYYLFGYSNAGATVVVWNLKTEVKSGQNKITLDQNNATTSN